MPGPFSARGSTILLGAIAVATGGFLILFGCGAVLDARPGDAPLWLGVCAGIAFGAAGIAVMIRGLAGATDQARDLPDGTPRWITVAYWLTTLGAVASLAMIGTWVAFGPGARHFTIAGIISGTAGETFGRGMFGLGAILSWIIVALFARAGIRRIFGRD